MNQPGRFGPFLLFQETESSRYRSCYRAGVTRGRAVERIVRLEVFDQPGFDPAELLIHLESSAALQARLEDPHIATGAGLGHVEATPYAAYDFELGTSLRAFSDAARLKAFPVPLDQALFIVERVALALAAAYRIESQGGPVLHSFLTPDSVLLSNVGEVKVCGFEVGKALRVQLAGESFCAPYLSPRCRAGQPPRAQDDVFSLGSLLWELICGTPLPTESTDLGEVIVQATGEPAPQSLQALLHNSVAPPAHRIPHVLDWQRALGKLILDGEYNPTTFNLAFLLHTLLREPLERGVESVEREKRFVLPQGGQHPSQETAVEISTAGTRTVTGFEVDGETGPPTTRHEAIASSPADRKPFWLGFSISAVTASLLLAAVLVLGGGSAKAPDRPLEPGSTPASSRVDAFDPSPPTEPARAESVRASTVSLSSVKPSVVLSEVVQGQLGRELDYDEIERVVAERTAEIERSLAAEYEKKLESLRREMAARSEQRDRLEEPARSNAIPADANPAPETNGAGRDDAAEPSSRAAAPAAAAPAAAETAVPGETPAPSTEPSTPSRPAPPGPDRIPFSEPREDTAGVTAVEPPDAPAPSPVLGTPVETPARLLRLQPPSYPPVAKRVGLSATARVKVLISSEGRVREAEIIGPELGSGFDRAALAAVQKSKWEPARRNGEPVDSTSIVTLEFQP